MKSPFFVHERHGHNGILREKTEKIRLLREIRVQNEHWLLLSENRERGAGAWNGHSKARRLEWIFSAHGLRSGPTG